MLLCTLISLSLSLSGSWNCSGEVDPYTRLTYCELHDIKRQIDSASYVNPLPWSVALMDTSIASHLQRKHALILSWKYEIVSCVCFNNKLSVGARHPGNGSFVCINEGR